MIDWPVLDSTFNDVLDSTFNDGTVGIDVPTVCICRDPVLLRRASDEAPSGGFEGRSCTRGRRCIRCSQVWLVSGEGEVWLVSGEGEVLSPVGEAFKPSSLHSPVLSKEIEVVGHEAGVVLAFASDFWLLA